MRVRVKLGALALMLGALSLSAHAGEIPQAVKDACSGDYQKHCHMHKPDSDGARNCMAGAFDKLSDPCVSAILNSDLVDQETPPTETAETPKAETHAATAPVHSGKVKKVRRAEKRHKTRVAQSHRSKGAHRTRVAHRGHVSGPNKVARYINRGTRIANFYVSKALAKAFR